MRVIVVGSGVVGASCAYTASGLGAEVVLADAALPGQATAAGAGIVCPWTSAPADDPVWYDVRLRLGPVLPGPGRRARRAGEPTWATARSARWSWPTPGSEQAEVHRQLLARRARRTRDR